MREIKFRAWDKENKKWSVLPFLEVDSGKIFEDGRAVEDYHSYRPDAFILMQFTGLKDKNGKEIYEGDIVRCPYYSNVNPNDYDDNTYLDTRPRIGQITWRQSEGKWEYAGESYYRMDEHYKMEVVGNIYENPDLLN